MMINPEASTADHYNVSLTVNSGSLTIGRVMPSGSSIPEKKCDCECHNESRLKTALEMAAIPITECVECRCWDRMKS